MVSKGVKILFSLQMSLSAIFDAEYDYTRKFGLCQTTKAMYHDT